MPTRILELPLIEVEIVVATNEDWRDAVQFPDADGAPIPLAGIGFWGVLRASASSQAAYCRFVTPGLVVPLATLSGAFVVGGGGLTLGFSVPASVMRDASPGAYPFDAIALADGVTRRVLKGTVTIEKGITR
jgi:hypothetical protein